MTATKKKLKVSGKNGVVSPFKYIQALKHIQALKYIEVLL